MKRKDNTYNAPLYLPLYYKGNSFMLPSPLYDDDRYFFKNFPTSFKQETAKALEKNIPVTYIENTTIYKTVNGIDKEVIGYVSPMIKIEQKLIKVK